MASYGSSTTSRGSLLAEDADYQVTKICRRGHGDCGIESWRVMAGGRIVKSAQSIALAAGTMYQGHEKATYDLSEVRRIVSRKVMP